MLHDLIVTPLQQVIGAVYTAIVFGAAALAWKRVVEPALESRKAKQAARAHADRVRRRYQRRERKRRHRDR